MCDTAYAKRVYKYQPRQSQSIFAVSLGTETKSFKSLEEEKCTEGVQRSTDVAKKLLACILSSSHSKTLYVPLS